MAPLAQIAKSPARPRLRRIPEPTKALVQSLYLSGIPAPAVSEQTGLTVGSIRTLIKRNRWSQARTKTREIVSQGGKGGLASVGTGGVSAVVVRQGATSAVSARVRQTLIDELEAQLAALRGKRVRVAELGTKSGNQGRSSIVKTIADTAAQVFPDWGQTSHGIIVMGELSESRWATPTAAIDVSATAQETVSQEGEPPQDSKSCESVTGT